jgi:hypothetical protein
MAEYRERLGKMTAIFKVWVGGAPGDHMPPLCVCVCVFVLCVCVFMRHVPRRARVSVVHGDAVLRGAVAAQGSEGCAGKDQGRVGGGRCVGEVQAVGACVATCCTEHY